MSIKETKIKGFNNPLLYDKLNYPQCTRGECPRFYFNSLHIGSRGSGKTHKNTVCDMVRHYETQTKMRDNTEYKLRTKMRDNTEYKEYIKYQDYYKTFCKTPESKLDKLYDDKPEIFHLLEQYDYVHPSLFPIDDKK